MATKKIKLFQRHFANIEECMLQEFHIRTGIINIISFIKQSAYNDFEIYLSHESDMIDFEKALKENFYKDKSEWLREKIRDEIKNCK
ncbi:hypothetical protein B5E87_04700 [Massilimicrobiota sp. An142]|uniref:hypothetical protein n=1 Tax=Massilimicrobiota sp. An142 TaxID=1965564 RepID=UPI000B3AA90B|nr:hypothetical protein [Massilimicrobiota sp. An142]OUQ13880.1 hypothetical protein B5E87_04700 [Massilimicrobiota sp. An142]